jgi:hypothetical protein
MASLFLIADAAAHGDLDWNDFTIDNKNNSVEVSLQKVKQVIGDVVLARREVSKWPDPELLRTRDELATLKEDVDDLLNHLREDGIRLQVTAALRENPRAGRSVAASHAIDMGIELLEHVAAQESAAAFEEELHVGGTGAYMFDLMDSYVDIMGLYAELTKKTD